VTLKLPEYHFSNIEHWSQ